MNYAVKEGGLTYAVVTYDDTTDTYCLRSNSPFKATLFTAWTDGTGRYNVTDYPGGGATCTGNLAITEDRQRKWWVDGSCYSSPCDSGYATGVHYHYS